MDIRTVDYVARLKRELLSRDMTNDEAEYIIQKSRFRTCLDESADEFICFPVNITADVLIQNVALQGYERREKIRRHRTTRTR